MAEKAKPWLAKVMGVNRKGEIVPLERKSFSETREVRFLRYLQVCEDLGRLPKKDEFFESEEEKPPCREGLLPK